MKTQSFSSPGRGEKDFWEPSWKVSGGLVGGCFWWPWGSGVPYSISFRIHMGHVCNGGVPPVCPGLASSGQSHLEQEEQGLLWERASLVAQMVKNLPTMREAWVGGLGQEDPLEKGMDTHSSMLAWRIPRAEKPGELQSMGSQRVGHDWVTHTHKHTHTPTLWEGPCALEEGGGVISPMDLEVEEVENLNGFPQRAFCMHMAWGGPLCGVTLCPQLITATPDLFPWFSHLKHSKRLPDSGSGP